MILKKPQYLFYLFLLFLSWPGEICAQSAEPDSLRVSTAETRSLELDRELHEELVSAGEYDYLLEPQNPESLWQRFRRWFLTNIYELFQKPWINLMVKVAFYLIFGIIFIALIIQLLGGDIQSAFSGTDRNKRMDLNTGIEDISSIDLQKEFEKALGARDYPLAVRYLYLMSIKELDDSGLLTWKKDKTNHEYLLELRGTVSYKPFSRLTYYYDYIEYGEFTIGEESFLKVRSLYDEIRKNGNRS